MTLISISCHAFKSSINPLQVLSLRKSYEAESSPFQFVFLNAFFKMCVPGGGMCIYLHIHLCSKHSSLHATKHVLTSTKELWLAGLHYELHLYKIAHLLLILRFCGSYNTNYTLLALLIKSIMILRCPYYSPLYLQKVVSSFSPVLTEWYRK